MEKLIKLINEYEKINMCRKFDNFAMHTFENSSGVDRLLEDTVISARYGFIKRLVDNDKIDFDKCGRCYEINSTYDHYNLENSQDLWLLMLLSIQDNPIEFLISILKIYNI